MKLRGVFVGGGLAWLASAQGGADAFAVHPCRRRSGTAVMRLSSAATDTDDSADCGCGEPTVGLFSGDVPEAVRSDFDPRNALRSTRLFRLSGEPVLMDELLDRSGPAPEKKNLSVAWSQHVDELEAQGVNLVLVSIGLPEKGKQLVDHLEFANGEDYLFVDPENALYDALQLNFGVQRTFFNVNTPFAFLDRIKRGDLANLKVILSKWNKALYIPPKDSQAFNQGGTFVFQGDQTLFAHYDPSTAAHARVDEVMEIVRRQRNEDDNVVSSEDFSTAAS